MKRSQAVEDWKTWIWSDKQWEPLIKFVKKKRHEDSGVLSFKIKLEVIYKMV